MLRFGVADLPIELPRETGLRWMTVVICCERCRYRSSHRFIAGTCDAVRCPPCGLVHELGFSIQTEPFDWPERN